MSKASLNPTLMVHLFTHLFTRGLFMLAISLTSTIAGSMMMAKHNEKMHGEEQEKREGASATYVPHRATFLPFQTFGLDYGCSAALRGIAALMRCLGPILTTIVAYINESWLIAAVCLPVGLYYLGGIFVSRVAPEVSQGRAR